MTSFTQAISGMEIKGPDLEDGDMVVDVVILSRVQRADRPASALMWHASSHTDAIVELGMMRAATLLIEDGYKQDEEDE